MAPGLLSQQTPNGAPASANGPTKDSAKPDVSHADIDIVTPAVPAVPAPSEIVANPGPVSTLSGLLISERVERARDTLVESALYGRLSQVSEAVYERAGAVWGFSKSTAWIVGTSVLVLVLPVLWEIDREASTAEAAAAIAAAADAPATPAAAPATPVAPATAAATS